MVGKLQWSVFSASDLPRVDPLLSHAFVTDGRYIVDKGVAYRAYFDNGFCLDLEYLGERQTRVAAELLAENHRSERLLNHVP